MSAENQSGNTGWPATLKIVGGKDENVGGGPAQQQPEIRIGKSWVPAEVDGRQTQVELFTMGLGEEAIYLAPLKTWSQLDIYKWRVQGKLPGTPAGLEITVDQVKIAGESVSTSDPEGCAKLERAFNDWLALERKLLEEAKQKDQAPSGQPATALGEDEPMRFEVARDKTGQPHIRCIEGKETVADVACTVPGITSLLNGGLMRKPGTWKIGALRDWLELDGHVFKFKDGSNGLAELESVLNQRYHPAEDEAALEVKVFANPGSESGFDIQFPATDGGLAENRRRHLDDKAIELLSDPQRCRVLRKGLLVRFTPPVFHFKRKTLDGGERELEPRPEHMVSVVGTDGQPKQIDLSQPVSHLGLDATALAAIFNHPSITRRVRRTQETDWTTGLDQAA